MKKMAGKTLKFIFILRLFSFIVEVFSEDMLEMEVEVDSKDEQKWLDELDDITNRGSDGNHENDAIDTDGDIQKPQYGATADSQNENDDIGNDDNGVNEKSDAIHENSENEHDATEEKEPKHQASSKLNPQEKFTEKPKPLWKSKDVPDKEKEPGFDLTSDEMKKFKIWKDGVIPYYIDVVSYSDKVIRDKIRNYLQMVNSATSVSFVELPGPPADDKERWVFIMNRRGLLGCADHTVKDFTNQGVQHVVIGYDCMETQGEMAEAVMSILGIPAQHNAPNRDEYIEINMENIKPDKKHLFEKLIDNEWLFHDLDYDFDSVTHYDLYKYSTNGRPTIRLKNESKDLDPPKVLSPTDILKIKMLYNYITRNVKLQTTECEKLFKPRNKFQRFVPNKALIKPRDKPSKYHLDGRMNLKYDDNDKYREKYLSQLVKNAEKIKAVKNKKNRNDNIKDERIGFKTGKVPVPEKSSGEEQRISKLEALAELSDYHSGDII